MSNFKKLGLGMKFILALIGFFTLLYVPYGILTRDEVDVLEEVGVIGEDHLGTITESYEYQGNHVIYFHTDTEDLVIIQDDFFTEDYRPVMAVEVFRRRYSDGTIEVCITGMEKCFKRSLQIKLPKKRLL